MKAKRISLWIPALSAFVALFICRNLFENSSFELSNFTDRTIGIAVLLGVDIAARSLFYIKLISIFIISFLLCFQGLSYIWAVAKREIGAKNLRTEGNVLLTLSLFSIFYLIYHYINGAEIIISILDIFKILTGLAFVVLISKIILYKRDSIFFDLINNYNLVVLSFLLPLVAFFVRWIIVSGSFVFTNSYFVLFFIFWIMYWVILRIYFQMVPKKIFSTKISSILFAAVPLLLIPISAPISNEVQYSLSMISTWSDKRFSITALIFLLATGLLIFLLNKSKKIKFNIARNFYLPIFIATITMFNMHTNFLDIDNFDMFHHGENLISTQQLFEYSKIPFVNLYPTHGLSYMLGQVLYAAVNGYTVFSPWLWEWIIKIFEVVLFYYVLSKITNSFFSATAIAFLPIIGIFGGQTLIYGYSKSLPTTYYFTPFFIGLILIWSLKKLTFKRMLLLWLSCLFLIAWRVDFGIVSFGSAGIVVLISILQKYIKSEPMSDNLQAIFKSLVVTLAFTLISLVVLSIAGSESFVTIIMQILEFIKFQAQAQGLPHIIASYSPASVFQYLILPLIGTFYVLYYLYKVFFERGHPIPGYKTLLLYVAIFSLVISVRSIQRQTFAVIGYNPYLFGFLLLCLPVYLAKTKNGIGLLQFSILLLTYQIILPNYQLLINSGQLVSLYNWRNKENRIHINDYKYKNLVTFINSNLSGDQTFLDLSSSPLLYVASGREFVNYFIPNAYYTSEIIQKKSLENISDAYLAGKIPIIIFQQPDLYANNIDNVPNEIRSYRIFEFVYSHYHPVGFVDRYFIWIANGTDLKNPLGLTPNPEVDQKFNLKMLPYYWGEYDPYMAVVKTEVLQKLVTGPVKVVSGNSIVLPINEDLDKKTGNYLHLEIESNSPGQVDISYGSNPVSKIIFDLVQSENPNNYLIRISSQYGWGRAGSYELRVLPSTDIVITQAYIRKGD